MEIRVSVLGKVAYKERESREDAEDVVYVKYESNSETFMCQMLAEFVCKKGTRMNESDLKDYKNS